MARTRRESRLEIGGKKNAPRAPAVGVELAAAFILRAFYNGSMHARIRPAVRVRVRARARLSSLVSLFTT